MLPDLNPVDNYCLQPYIFNSPNKNGPEEDTVVNKKSQKRVLRVTRTMFMVCVIFTFIFMLPTVTTASDQVIKLKNQPLGEITLVRDRHRGGGHNSGRIVGDILHGLSHGGGPYVAPHNSYVDPHYVAPHYNPPAQLFALPYHNDLNYMRGLPNHCGNILAWASQGRVPPGWHVNAFNHEVGHCQGVHYSPYR